MTSFMSISYSKVDNKKPLKISFLYAPICLSKTIEDLLTRYWKAVIQALISQYQIERGRNLQLI